MNLFKRNGRAEAQPIVVKDVVTDDILAQAKFENADRDLFRTLLPDGARRKYIEKEVFEGRGGTLPLTSEEQVAIARYLPESRKKA